MYGLNIDPRNPNGKPAPTELHSLGVERVRYTFKDATAGHRPGLDALAFYRRQIEALDRAGIRSLLVLTGESCPDQPEAAASLEVWQQYATRFARRAAEIARVLAPWRPAFQLWHAPDLAHPSGDYDPTLAEPVFGMLLAQTYQAIKEVDSGLQVVLGGLVSGRPAWLTGVKDSLNGRLPADAVAVHPYGKRPSPDWPAPDWGSGNLADLLQSYRQVTDLPLWLTEVGVDVPDEETQADYLRRFYRTVTAEFAGDVEYVFWFCYSDGMAHGYGLIDNQGRPKQAYEAYAEIARPRSAADAAGGIAATASVRTQAAVSLDRLHEFARYLEQSIVFGTRDQAIQHQLEAELRGNPQQLSKVDIWRLMRQMLAGSPHPITQSEVNALDLLQSQKDLYGLLRSIVLAAHQKTGALSGRLGVHSRISAETEPNAITNIKAVMRILDHVQPGNRMILTDMVKAVADEGQLTAPDVFETDIYGQHRNGLVDNHAWNLQKLVRAIRDRGYQDRIILMIRLDGPDGGANVNPFNPASLRKYELAIGKLVRYLEAMLPTVPFKLVLGNEPDLPQERQWSDPTLEPRPFILNSFAPATGTFMKKIARQRPDVTFICPALSANLKYDQLAYYSAFFGEERPDNLVPALHGYAADVATLPAGQRNLLEQQAHALRVLGGFLQVSGTEIGSGNPFGDVENLSEKGRFDDVVAWILLSTEHRTPPFQDNHWNFKIDPGRDDPTARHFADIVNRTKNRVIRNIRERDGSGLQILQHHPVDRPAYGVEYLEHNMPATLVVGQTNAVQITVRNTSYQTWPAAGPHPVRIGYHWYTAEGNDVPPTLWEDLRTNLPYDLGPGERVTLNCNLGVPRTSGEYEVRWDMVEELRTWFAWQGAPTLDVRVTVQEEPVEPPPQPPPAGGLRVSASHNNRQEGADNLQQAIDNNAYTRWSSRQPQSPGMWFQIDLGETRPVSQLRLDTEGSPRDYPRGYVVRVSEDGQNWRAVAENPLNDKALNVTFPSQPVRFIRIEQTGSDSVYWWSIHSIEISGEAKISLSASHNNVLIGADNVAQALDDNPQTRWSSRVVQQPGMWVELDLNESRMVSGVAFDTSGSPNDYPRGYVVQLSTNRDRWETAARNDQNSQALDVTFTARPARYIRVEQTGRADRWWWSIHGITVYHDEGAPPPVTISASHNNVWTGVDNLAQALDGNPQTRWSTQVVQQPGMWVEFDLNTTRTVSGITIDTAASPNDFPYGYVVRLSQDHNQWVEVARNDNNNAALDVNFSPRLARYIRIEQTGRSDRWWWSVHGVTIRP